MPVSRPSNTAELKIAMMTLPTVCVIAERKAGAIDRTSKKKSEKTAMWPQMMEMTPALEWRAVGWA